jgi:sigma-B regulation protein RsbU (phosphoserine phosphatase)
MLFYHLFINLVGVWIIIILSFRSISPPFYKIADFAHRINLIFIPIFFAIFILGQYLYEKPIRIYLDSIKSDKLKDAQFKLKAQKRLLNAPFFIGGLDLIAWTGAAIVYSIMYANFASIELASQQVFFQNALVGLISCTATFFVFEQIIQRKMAPVFFPDGGLYMIPDTARIRISTRLTVFIVAVNFIPFIALLIIVQGTYGTYLSSSILLEHIRSSVVTNSIVSISIGIFMTIIVIFNFSRPIKNIILMLKKIKDGDLKDKVRVTTNDELGYAGDVINEMTTGLKERERMKHSLELAQGVQLNLLPKKAPDIEGLDICGTSIYCDETGGDYYDYLNLKPADGEKLGVVIGDVSDHGVHSALLMTTARAFIRLRSSTADSISKIVSDVNYHLTIDIESGGQFMTLFYLVIDIKNRSLEWVRAGHDPGIIYDPEKDVIEELKGRGIPLGIDQDYQYNLDKRVGLKKGEIIVLGTDGIWEAGNGKGEIFGKERFYDLIRKNSMLDATSIRNKVIENIQAFRNGYKIEDDITLVVVKINH